MKKVLLFILCLLSVNLYAQRLNSDGLNTMMKTDCRKLFTRTHIHPHSSHYQTVQPTKRSSAKTEMSLRSHHS